MYSKRVDSQTTKKISCKILTYITVIICIISLNEFIDCWEQNIKLIVIKIIFKV